MKKFIATLTVLTAIATPAFSQVLPSSHKGTHPQNHKIALRQDALHAFAAVPGAGSIANPDAPAATGGGSVGYNEMLRTF